MKNKKLILAPILALLALMLLLPPLLTRADDPPVFVLKWGTQGSGDGQFASPKGIAVDSKGDVYVADGSFPGSTQRVQKFDSNGNFLIKWGSQGSGDGQFEQPRGVAIDSADNVYIVDGGNHRVQKFDSSGNFITKWGSQGSGDGQFNFPTHIALDSAGNIYIADTGNTRVQKFDGNGTFLTKWGSEGTGDGQFGFHAVNGVAVDSADNVYVVDGDPCLGCNQRIQKFDSNGTFLIKWGSSGTGDGQFNAPQGIAVDSRGDIYVVDAGNARVQKFDSNGNFLTKWGSQGSGDGQFASPYGIAVDGGGNIYVGDDSIRRIQKFSQPGLVFPPLLTLTKAVDNTEPAPGQQINYIITVNNSGFFSATNALISDTLPVSITFAGPVTLDPFQPSTILATSALSLPTLASNVVISPQTSITLTLPVTVNVDLTATTTAIVNTAAVTSPEISTPVKGSAVLGGRPIYLPIVVKN